VIQTRCFLGRIPVSILLYFNIWKIWWTPDSEHCHTSRQKKKHIPCYDQSILQMRLRRYAAPSSKLLPYESLIPFACYFPSRFRSDHLWTTPGRINHPPLRRLYLHYELLRTLRKQISSALPYFLIHQYGKVLMPLRSKIYRNNRSYFSSYFTVNITGPSL